MNVEVGTEAAQFPEKEYIRKWDFPCSAGHFCFNLISTVQYYTLYTLWRACCLHCLVGGELSAENDAHTTATTADLFTRRRAVLAHRLPGMEDDAQDGLILSHFARHQMRAQVQIGAAASGRRISCCWR